MTNNKIITFHILFALQFVLVAAGMLVNVKVGLFSMVIILLFTVICLIQLSNSEETNWKTGQNVMTYMFTGWLCFYLLEILNPNNVLAAWNINLTPYALIPLICAFVVPLVVRTKKDIELLLIIWSVFVLIFTIKGYWQKTMVSAPKTSISCTCWADGVHTSSGRASAISPASPTQQTTEYTLPCPLWSLPSPPSLWSPNGYASTSSASPSGDFTEWVFREPVQLWESSWEEC